MSKNKTIPKLNLTVEEVAEALKNIKPEDLFPPKDKLLTKAFYNCDHCNDQGTVQVYGLGPNMTCPACGPRY